VDHLGSGAACVELEIALPRSKEERSTDRHRKLDFDNLRQVMSHSL
jgi:hypothetical protein